MQFFFKKQPEQDWPKFFGNMPATSKKQRLIEACRKLDVGIHVDDPTENVYTVFRAAASEAELERRILVKISVDYSLQSRRIAVTALIISVCAFLWDVYGVWS